MSKPIVTPFATRLSSQESLRGALQNEERLQRRLIRGSRTVGTLRDDAKSLASDGDTPSPMPSGQTTAQGRIYHSSPYGDTPSPMASGQTTAQKGVYHSSPYGDTPSPMASGQTTAQKGVYHSSPYGDTPSPMASGQTTAQGGVQHSPPYGQRPTRSTFPLRVISPAERLSHLQMSARLAARAAASPTTHDTLPLRQLASEPTSRPWSVPTRPSTSRSHPSSPVPSDTSIFAATERKYAAATHPSPSAMALSGFVAPNPVSPLLRQKRKVQGHIPTRPNGFVAPNPLNKVQKPIRSAFPLRASERLSRHLMTDRLTARAAAHGHPSPPMPSASTPPPYPPALSTQAPGTNTKVATAAEDAEVAAVFQLKQVFYGLHPDYSNGNLPSLSPTSAPRPYQQSLTFLDDSGASSRAHLESIHRWFRIARNDQPQTMRRIKPGGGSLQYIYKQACELVLFWKLLGALQASIIATNTTFYFYWYQRLPWTTSVCPLDPTFQIQLLSTRRPYPTPIFFSYHQRLASGGVLEY